MIKKILISLLFMFLSVNFAYSEISNADLVRSGILKYKKQNYAGCISTMREAIKNDPSNATAHYYVAISYARMGDKTEAINYYTKVITLNSNATLTAYAKQGLEAINNGYKYNTQNSEAEKFMQANYKDSVSPDIKKQLKMIELESKKEEINTKIKNYKKEIKEEENKTEKKSLNNEPTDAEIAQAVKTFAKLGFNPLGLNGGMSQLNTMQGMQQYFQTPEANQLSQLQMMLGTQNNNNNFNNNMMNFLPYLMQNNQGNSAQSQEFIQTMMMTQMMPDFSFDTSKND